MRTVLDIEGCRLVHGDAANLNLPLNSVDAIVTDPPAGIGFMGKAWDGDKGGRDGWIAWLAATIRPAFSALKPGGHALVWALPRTSHWTATAMEDCGFEIRDVHHHLFGTGFPKSLNIGKATANDNEWSGWGTALKPAAEHWILCRKPLEGTVASNVLQYGTGGLNIDATRIDSADDCRRNSRGGENGLDGTSTFKIRERLAEEQPERSGRWPAHVSFDEEAAAVLDAQSGISKDGIAVNRNRTQRKPSPVGYAPAVITGAAARDQGYGGKGGASRFFYVTKPSRSEKEAGLKHLPQRTAGEATDREEDSAGLSNPRAGAGRTGGARNFHPTVKSIALMRWLVRLITPPGGVVLDPFAGSGSTGVAALAEGMRFIGVEASDEYLPIASGRLEHALKGEER